MIIILGAGSFGHPIARQFDLQRGVTSSVDDTERLVGSLQCNRSIRLLAEQFSASLAFPSIVVEAAQSFTLGDPLDCTVDGFISKLLDFGICPVVFGSMVFNGAGDRLGILSGDDIMRHFAESFHSRIRRVVFCSAHAVYSADPRIRESKLIRTLSESSSASFVDDDSIDVTNSMRGKVAAALSIVRKNPLLNVFIAPIESFLNLEDESFKWTRVMAEPSQYRGE